PLHALDEEQSLTPRLLPLAPLELADALGRQAREHAEADLNLAKLKPLWASLAIDREVDRALQVQPLVLLQAPFDTHLRLEGAEIFPAVRRLLPPETLVEIGAEMQARRQERIASR